MLKTTILLTVSLVCAGTLSAQTEAQKKDKPLGTATPADVNTAGKPTPGKVPPTSAAQEPSTANAPKIDKNPKPIDRANMDLSVKPSDDFFEYANGTWIKNNPIPPEFTRWGSFNELAEKNNDALHTIAEKAAKDAEKLKSADKVEQAAAADIQKVGDYYASGMDEKKIDADGVKPLADEFKRIDGLTSKDDVVKEVGHLHLMGVNALFRFGSGQDEKESTRVIAQAH